MPYVRLRRYIFLGIPGLFAVMAGLVVIVPSWRQSVGAKFIRTEREVLATAEGDLLNNGTLAKVVKYRSADGIYVEVLRVGENGATTPVDKVLLPDKQDGLFNFQGHVTRLAIADIDDDGTMELLAPTFDNQLVPHLNVFRYNPATSRFELFQPGK